MIDSFLYIGLPYLAIITCILGLVWRWRTNKFSISSLSSQFLEDRHLLWGSVPWHLAIIVVLITHFVMLLLPGIWQSIISRPSRLLAIESVELGAALLALIGLTVLAFRRLTSARVQAFTSTMDLLVLALLAMQVVLGILTATLYAPGAAWASGTLTPYLLGILTFVPDPAFVVDFPPLVKFHILGAWLLLLVLPFSRLVHILALPVQYLFRAPQLVIWNNARRREQAVATLVRSETRREFFKGSVGVGAAVLLMGLGVMGKVFGFFKGPRLEGEAETALLEKRLQRLKAAADQRALELERQRTPYILVARLSELQANKGRYFTDYSMAPALAFKSADGLPLFISAKCTHLGCTVSNELTQGKLLCPCHISFFNLSTGAPDPGSPAKDPLQQLAWAILDAKGNVLVSKLPGKPVQGESNAEKLQNASVYLVKPKQPLA